jgi:hypothetical protein
MARPKCCRQVAVLPGKSCFQPEGGIAPCPEEVHLTLDEYEALRLADLEGLYQQEAAFRMKISRQTFGRIVGEARCKVADVLVNGKILRIGGGSVSIRTAEDRRCPLCRRSFPAVGGAPRGESCPHCRLHAQDQ